MNLVDVLKHNDKFYKHQTRSNYALAHVNMVHGEPETLADKLAIDMARTVARQLGKGIKIRYRGWRSQYKSSTKKANAYGAAIYTR